VCELQHDGGMAETCPQPAQDQRLRREDALKIYNKGTKVVCAVRSDGRLIYVWGTVQDFMRPRWRICYGDSEWEDLTSSQMRNSVLLALEVSAGARQSAPVTGAHDPPPDDRDPTAMELIACPAMPADFGVKYEKQLLRMKFDSGWSRGEIKKLVSKNVERQEFTALCAFPDTSGRADVERRIKLRAGNYRVPRESPASSWHLLLWMPATAADAIAPVPAPVPALPDGKRRRTIDR